MPNAFGFDDDEYTEPDPADPFAAAPVVTDELEPEEGEESPLAEQVPPAQGPQPDPAAATQITPPPAADAQPTGDAAGGEGAAPVTDGAPAPWTSRWVGEGRKYADQAQLEQGLDNALEMSQRAADRAAAAEAQAAQLSDYLRQAAAMQQTPPAPDMSAVAAQIRSFAEAQGWDENQTRQFAQIVGSVAQAQAAPAVAEAQAVRAQIAQTQAQSYEASQQLATDQAWRSDVAGWRQAHGTELAQDGAFEERVGQVISALDVWEDEPIVLNRRTLDIATEAATNPALLGVLQAMPDFMATDEGMMLARKLAGDAGTPAGAAPAPVGSQPTPHVESGGSGLRPNQPDTDEWEVLKLARKERQTASPLGI